MKYRLILIIALILPIVVTAQTDNVNADKIKPPSLIIAIQADVHVASVYAYRSATSFILVSGGGALFTRKYLGQHFALELGINQNYSEKTFGEEYRPVVFPATSSPVSYIFSYRIKSLEIPLQFQYHMGKKNNKLRPYVGLGIGYAAVTSYSDYKDDVTGAWGNDIFTETISRPMIQITEGVTYRIGNRLQVNQSLYYKMVHDIGGHRMGINFGLGYIIM